MNDRNKLFAIPSGLDPEIAERIGQYYRDGAFEFEFGTEEFITVEGNTVYHIIPHFSEDGAESVLAKLRRIIGKRLEEDI